MNTTSMEYVICQEKTNKAPLILSEFMGISTTMRDALYVILLSPCFLSPIMQLADIQSRGGVACRQINPWDLGVSQNPLLWSHDPRRSRTDLI